MKPNGIEWIGDIPDDWKVIRGKYTLDLLTRSTRDNDEVITCFRDGQVTLRSNRREDGFTFADKEIGYQGIRKGDLVIHGMDGFAGAIGISDSDGKGSPVLNVCRVKNKSDIRYINYYLRSLAWQNVFLAMTTGIRERSCDLRWKKIAELYFIVPPHQTQQKIADYLDEKCGEIDKTIEKQKESIEKLKAYKQSLISETVTKGLNKITPLKPTGIKWLGNIPKDWEVCRLKDVVDIYTGNSISDNLKSYYEVQKDAKPYISSKDIDITYKTINYKSGLYVKNNDASFKVAPKNSILICIEGGSAGKKKAFVECDITFVNKLACFNIRNFRLSNKYLYYFICSPNFEDFFASNISGLIGGVSVSILKNFSIILPPLKVQEKIVSYLEKMIIKFDSTINKKQKIIEKLDAYKKSLIFECVTGKTLI